MDIKSLLKRKQDETLVVGGSETLSAAKPKRDLVEIVSVVSIIVILGVLAWTFMSFGALLQDRALLVKKYYDVLEQKKTEEKNLESLKVLSGKADTLKEDLLLVNRAVSQEPRPDQIVALLESTFNQLKRKYLVFMPEAISWVEVVPDDISNDEIASGVGVMEYRFGYKGDYAGFLALLETLREGQQIIDVRSINGLALDEDGLVTASLSAWVYNVLL